MFTEENVKHWEELALGETTEQEAGLLTSFGALVMPSKVPDIRHRAVVLSVCLARFGFA